jgi:hypothetical protein
MTLGDESTLGRSKLEGPHGVVDLLEVGSAGEEFVNQIFNADAAFVLQVIFNNHVVGDGDTGTVDLQEAALVDQVTDGLEGRSAVGHEGLDLLEHVEGGRVDTDQGGVVDLAESQETEDFGDVGVELVDTKN